MVVAISAPTAEDFAHSRLLSYAAAQFPGYRIGWHHREIAKKLQAVERGEIKRLMISMPPRHGKSMLASEYFPAWFLGRNPDKYIIAASYAQELADDFGRKVRNQLSDTTFQCIFPGCKLADDSTSAKRFNTESGGSYFAVGAGGPITGRGAHLLLIDDPIKNREDAESETMRRKLWDWYTSTAYTRLMPDAAVVVIMCMAGHTRVMMADGSEKPLRDIRAGDLVATYKDGSLSTSRILNWVNHGSDSVLEISTTSGISVIANKRHPFLVVREGVETWVRVENLLVGDTIRRVSIGVSGEESSALSKSVISQQSARVCVTHTITKRDGNPAIDRHRSTQNPDVRLESSTDMALQPVSTTECRVNRGGFALSVTSLQQETSALIGAKNCASTTTTKQEQLGDCSATTATLQSDMEEHTSDLCGRLSTYAIVNDTIESIKDAGSEDVFDIQVEHTENFIANGLISHNTRWHEDDLAGRILESAKDGEWELLTLPAVRDGEALWPEQYSLEALEGIRVTIGTRDWSALYMQEPAPEDGDFFKKEHFRWCKELPKHLTYYGASDYAVTSAGGDYTVHMVAGVDADDNIYIVDMWRGQSDSLVWVEALMDLIMRYRPVSWAEETGQIRSAMGPLIDKRQRERSAYCHREAFPTKHDKAIRAQSIRGRVSLGKVYFLKDAPWVDKLCLELLQFPNGKHDDQVDAFGLIGQLVDKMRHNKYDKLNYRKRTVV